MAGPAYVCKLTVCNPTVVALCQAAQLLAGIIVLVQGVNMLLAVITPAFKGFSEKMFPSADSGTPLSILFKGTSNAYLAGFCVSYFGGYFSMGVQIIIGTTMFIPGM